MDSMQRMDDRAQAIGILRLFLGLAVGAVVLWILDLAAGPMLSRAANSASDETSAQGTEWLQEGLQYMPMLFLGVSFFGLIAYSVYSREVGR